MDVKSRFFQPPKKSKYIKQTWDALLAACAKSPALQCLCWKRKALQKESRGFLNAFVLQALIPGPWHLKQGHSGTKHSQAGRILTRTHILLHHCRSHMSDKLYKLPMLTYVVVEADHLSSQWSLRWVVTLYASLIQLLSPYLSDSLSLTPTLFPSHTTLSRVQSLHINHTMKTGAPASLLLSAP